MSQTVKPGAPFCPRKLFYGPTIPLAVLSNRVLSDGAKLAWGRLAMYQGDKTTCVPSAGTLADDLGWSLASAKRALAELIDKKFAKRQRRGHGRTAETSLLWHSSFANGLRQAGSVLIQQETPVPPESNIQDGSGLSCHGDFETAQIRTYDGSGLIRQDGSGLSCALKEEEIQLEENQQRESAAAENSGRPQQQSEPEEAAADPIFDSETQNPWLRPKTSVWDQTDDEDEKPAVAPRIYANEAEAIEAAILSNGIKCMDGDAAEIVRLVKAKGIPESHRLEILTGFIASKNKRGRIETSKLLVKACRENDLEQWFDSKDAQSIRLGLEYARQEVEAEQRQNERLEKRLSVADAAKVAMEYEHVHINQIVRDRLQRKGIEEISVRELIELNRRLPNCAECKGRGTRGTAVLRTLRYCECEIGREESADLGDESLQQRMDDANSSFKKRLVAALHNVPSPFAAEAVESGLVLVQERENGTINVRGGTRLFTKHEFEAALRYLDDERTMLFNEPDCRDCNDIGLLPADSFNTKQFRFCTCANGRILAAEKERKAS